MDQAHAYVDARKVRQTQADYEEAKVARDKAQYAKAKADQSGDQAAVYQAAKTLKDADAQYAQVRDDDKTSKKETKENKHSSFPG